MPSIAGEGAFGKVLLVQNRLDHKVHAMKVISKALLRKKNNVQYMKSEREILTKLRHPFLVHLQFAFQSSSKLFLVMDFLAGMSKHGLSLIARSRLTITVNS